MLVFAHVLSQESRHRQQFNYEVNIQRLNGEGHISHNDLYLTKELSTLQMRAAHLDLTSNRTVIAFRLFYLAYRLSKVECRIHFVDACDVFI